MTDEIRDLSDVEIDAIAGGLQYNDNPQNYVMSPPPAEPQSGGPKPDNQPHGLVVMPDPGFVMSTAGPAPGSNSFSSGDNQQG
jgi:hypothetical protein